MTNQIVRSVIITLHFPYNNKICSSPLSGLAAECLDRARLHSRKSVHSLHIMQNKVDLLIHPATSLRTERTLRNPFCMSWEIYLFIFRPIQPSILGSSSPRSFKSWTKLLSASWPSPHKATPCPAMNHKLDKIFAKNWRLSFFHQHAVVITCSTMVTPPLPTALLWHADDSWFMIPSVASFQLQNSLHMKVVSLRFNVVFLLFIVLTHKWQNSLSSSSQ